MKNRLKMALCAVLLAAGLCACEKEDIDIDQLVGSRHRLSLRWLDRNSASDNCHLWSEHYTFEK